MAKKMEHPTHGLFYCVVCVFALLVCNLDHALLFLPYGLVFNFWCHICPLQLVFCTVCQPPVLCTHVLLPHQMCFSPSPALVGGAGQRGEEATPQARRAPMGAAGGQSSVWGCQTRGHLPPPCLVIWWEWGGRGGSCKRVQHWEMIATSLDSMEQWAR